MSLLKGGFLKDIGTLCLMLCKIDICILSYIHILTFVNIRLTTQRVVDGCTECIP